MFEWHKKEKPFLGMAGMGGGVAGKLFRGLGSFSATGGNVNGLAPGNGYIIHLRVLELLLFLELQELKFSLLEEVAVAVLMLVAVEVPVE
jgi:hypothetical protein